MNVLPAQVSGEFLEGDVVDARQLPQQVLVLFQSRCLILNSCSNHHGNTIIMATQLPWQHNYHSNTITMATQLSQLHNHHGNTMAMAT